MSKSNQQNYKNHAKFDPLYHFVLAPITTIVFVFSTIEMIQEDYELDSIILVGVALCILLLVGLLRIYATKLQDRIIVSEERFRHYRLTGKPLDSRLSVSQIIALRFAPDESYPTLCTRAADSGLSSNAIKQSITKWRADYYRV
ncbi:DUF6526 family protein [Paenibacillus sp. N1-5-1-14]|uniref:DUF6526 family protein n=1 Tax=Paenibacillus radicibacter TaxID=2972488 RepID=UPI002159752E|nr:DUF6526 family protein [Paenibacillus radicibacter]MCR8642855.1 DUF6526 family protein [Paenibacillus radicibacter]